MKDLTFKIMKTFLAILAILFFITNSLIFILLTAELYWAQSQGLILGPVSHANSDAWGLAVIMTIASLLCLIMYSYFLYINIKKLPKGE